LNYWQFGDYLGLGAGAHGKVTRLTEQCIERRVKPRNPRTYLERASDPAAVAVERVASAPSVALEFLLNALRLVGGVDEETLVARAGQGAQNLAAGRAAGLERGWLEPMPGRWCATPAGLEHLNPLLTLFA
jgi:coproporphyrinogen III oxidase-like Fe-S oxidoreductase